MAQPNTLLIMNQIQAMLQALTINAQPAYATVVLGAQKDWTDAWPVAEVMFAEDLSEHFRAGGYIRDTQGFVVRSAVSWTKQTPLQAVTQFCNIRDAATYLFQSHAYLQNAVPGVDDSRVKPVPAKISFIEVGGDDYLVHELIVEVSSDWTVPIGATGI